MPTYGRPPKYLHLLEEAVECFRRQDYPLDRRELIIINDCSQQTLVCNVPGVKCINVRQRYPSLGGKYNSLVAYSKGEVILPWEDDDISLPNRVSQAVERLNGPLHNLYQDELKPREKFSYFNPQRSWFLDNGGANPGGVGLHFEHSHGVCHNSGAFTREAFYAVGGYPSVSGPQDAQMDQRLKALGRTALPLGDDPAEWSFIYRWGVSDCHLSGHADPEAKYVEWGKRDWPVGRFIIEPKWQRDYVAMTRQPIVLKDQAFTKRNLLYHVCPFKNDAWRWNVQQLLKRINIFNGKKVVAILTGDGLEHPNEVRKAFNIDYISGSHVDEFIEMPNDPKFREVLTHEPLWSKVESNDPGEITFYGHAKGVSKKPDYAIQRWTEIMYEACLDYLPLVKKLLQRKPTVGCFKKVGRGWPESESGWHFSGTFFWVRNRDVFSRDWRTIDQIWFGEESWPSLIFTERESDTLFFQGTTQDMDLYLPEKFEKEIDPAYEQWQKQNEHFRVAQGSIRP